MKRMLRRIEPADLRIERCAFPKTVFLNTTQVLVEIKKGQAVGGGSGKGGETAGYPSLLCRKGTVVQLPVVPISARKSIF